MTKFDPKIHHRRSIRLQEYDYSQAGAYFVTLVTWRREALFGEVVNGEMRLNQLGKIVEWEWLELSKRLRYVELGTHMVMPNHFHGNLFIHENVGATRRGQTVALSGTEPLQSEATEGIDGSPLHAIQGKTVASSGAKALQSKALEGIGGSPLPNGTKPASLGAIIAQFKSRVTKRIWKIPEFKETPIWQRNYYEHIIRNERDLQNKTEYIEANPLLWDEDNENPVNVKP